MPRTPYPVPFGWFAVAWPEDVTADRTPPIQCLDRLLVAWRDRSGQPHVADAHDPDRRYPTIDRNGVVLVWYHPDPEVGPLWETKVVAELDDPEWHVPIRAEATIDNHLQELAENQVDTAHFRFVHGATAVPQISSYETGFPCAEMSASQLLSMPENQPVPTRLHISSDGPGVASVRFNGLVDTIDVAHSTPVTLDQTIVRSQFRVRTLGDPELTSMAAEAFVSEVQRQMVEEDGPIWTHKKHLPNPALADADGPVLRFRRWFAQFYAETPVAEGRWEPPWWPERVDEAPSGRVMRDALMLDVAARRAE